MKKSRKKRTFSGFGLKVRRPFVNKRNRLMLGSGRKKKLKQKGGFFHQGGLKELIEGKRWKNEEIG